MKCPTRQLNHSFSPSSPMLGDMGTWGIPLIRVGGMKDRFIFLWIEFEEPISLSAQEIGRFDAEQLMEQLMEQVPAASHCLGYQLMELCTVIASQVLER